MCSSDLSCSVNNTHRIMKIDVSDLSRVQIFDIDSQNHEVAGIATDGNLLYVVSYCSADGNRIWKYDINDGSYMGYIQLSKTLSGVQGISYRADEDIFYISLVHPDSVVAVDKDGTYIDTVWLSTGIVNEGLDYTQEKMLVVGLNETSQSIENLYTLKSKGFTLSAWVDPNDITNEHAVISRYKYDLNQRQYYLFVQNNKWFFRVGTNGGS